MNKKEIIEILKRRDHVSENEATQIVNDCAEAIYEAISMGNSLDTIEDILRDFLGLEPDYLEAFIL